MVFCLMICYVFAFQSLVRCTLLSEPFVVFIYWKPFWTTKHKEIITNFSWTEGKKLNYWTTLVYHFHSVHFVGSLLNSQGALHLFSWLACSNKRILSATPIGIKRMMILWCIAHLVLYFVLTTSFLALSPMDVQAACTQVRIPNMLLCYTRTGWYEKEINIKLVFYIFYI